MCVCACLCVCVLGTGVQETGQEQKNWSKEVFGLHPEGTRKPLTYGKQEVI